MNSSLTSYNAPLKELRRSTFTMGSLERCANLSYEKPRTYNPITPKSNSYLGLLWDSKDYYDHRKKVLEAKPMLDDSPPQIAIPQMCKTKALVDQADRLTKIHKENKILLQKINTINRTKGCVDCWNKTVNYISMSNRIPRLRVANAITKDNLALYMKLVNAKSFYEQKGLQKEWEKSEKYMEVLARYPLIWKEKKDESSKREKQISITGIDTALTRSYASKYFIRPKRPRCFLEFKAGDEYLGKIVAELYNDFVPLTVKNFIHYCQNRKEKRKSSDRGTILTYAGCPVHRIVPGYYFQSGDIIAGNGSDGISIYGPAFPDENFRLMHTQPGVLSMTNQGPNTNNSQFMITFKKLETLNGKQVVFGRMVHGFKILPKIEDFGTRTGRPRSKVFISNCGISR